MWWVIYIEVRQHLLKSSSEVTYCNVISQIDVVMNNEDSIVTHYNFPNDSDVRVLDGHKEKNISNEAFSYSVQFTSRKLINTFRHVIPT